MIPMPGESYHAPLPPATDELRALEHELRSYVHMLAGEIGERNVFHYTQLVQAAEYIGKTLSEAGYEVARQEYEVNEQICENLEAEVRGTERPDEIVLIGAHYDSVKGSPGANDNATGVAAMLALARAFSQNSSFTNITVCGIYQRRTPVLSKPPHGEPGLRETQPPTCRKYHSNAQSGNYWVLFRRTGQSKLRVPASLLLSVYGEFYCLCQQCRERVVGAAPH